MQNNSYITGPTKRTPAILLDKGKICILGRSIPDKPREFYIPVINWIDNYIHEFSGNTEVILGFDFINTASTKFIFLILKQLAESKNIEAGSTVKWYFEEDDEDMIELGQILNALIDCPFEFKPTEVIDQAFCNNMLKRESF